MELTHVKPFTYPFSPRWNFIQIFKSSWWHSQFIILTNYGWYSWNEMFWVSDISDIFNVQLQFYSDRKHSSRCGIKTDFYNWVTISRNVVWYRNIRMIIPEENALIYFICFKLDEFYFNDLQWLYASSAEDF